MPTETINITGSNVTSSQDTNVLLSLGGTPTGAALEPFSINVSWSGQLSAARGGTGLNSIGTSLQLLRTNTLATGLEYFSASTSDIPEVSNLYFTEARTRSTTLTGLSVTGSSVVSTDTILQAFGKLQNQVNGLVGGVIYKGTWNATTNSPALASGVGTKGNYYIVDVAGSTNLDGITDWKLGDWCIFNGVTWQKVDNTDAVISVNGYIGAVVLVKADVGLGNVEDTALSTWSGSINITTLGTIASGTWNAGVISKTYGGTGVNISTQALTLGTASANAGSIIFQNATNANTLTINSGVTSASYSLTLPTAQGGASTVLTNDGTGVLSWAASGSGLTVGTTTVASGTDRRFFYQSGASPSGVVQQSIKDFYAQSASPFAHVFASGRSGTITGARNSAFGYNAAFSLTSGTDNTAFGFDALYAVSTSNFSTAFGSSALENSTGTSNTAVGYYSQGVGSGAGTLNTSIGTNSLRNRTSGQYNVALGAEALYTNQTGSFNIAIGFEACYTGNLSGTIGIGYFANPTTSNTGVIGSNQSESRLDAIYFNSPTSSGGSIYDIILSGSGGSGSNAASANMSLQGGAPTGTSTIGGALNLRGYTALGSGSTAQTATTVLQITNATTVTVSNAVNFVFNATTGTKLGTETSQKIAFWNTTPIVQPTTAVAAATVSHVGGAAISENDTIGGYTLAQIVQALRNLGILA
jgi:hypothetical protein